VPCTGQGWRCAVIRNGSDQERPEADGQIFPDRNMPRIISRNGGWADRLIKEFNEGGRRNRYNLHLNFREAVGGGIEFVGGVDNTDVPAARVLHHLVAGRKAALHRALFRFGDDGNVLEMAAAQVHADAETAGGNQRQHGQ